jgi:hypothetical protein
MISLIDEISRRPQVTRLSVSGCGLVAASAMQEVDRVLTTV